MRLIEDDESFLLAQTKDAPARVADPLSAYRAGKAPLCYRWTFRAAPRPGGREPSCASAPTVRTT